MVSQTTPRFTREGLYYLGVLLFVISGAVAKELNLMLVLCGIMVAPLIFQARLVASSLRRLSFGRRVPSHVCAGEPFHVRLIVTNHRRMLPSWLLVVRDQLHLEGAGAAAIASEVDVRVPYIGPQETREIAYRVCLTHRGYYEIGPASISTRSPLGLLSSRRRLPARDRILVYPRLGRMTADWRRMVFGPAGGNQQSRARKGFHEGEFFGLREWRPGDTARWVHWRTSARLGTLAVKQFEQHRRLDLGLLLDLWQPAEPTEQDVLRLETAISLAATAISDLGREPHTKLTVVMAAPTIASWSALASGALAQELLERLATVQGSQVSLQPAAQQLRQLMSPTGRVLVISTRDHNAALQHSAQPVAAVQPATLESAAVPVGQTQVSHTGQASSQASSAAASNGADLLSRAVWIDVGGSGWDRYFY